MKRLMSASLGLVLGLAPLALAAAEAPDHRPPHLRNPALQAPQGNGQPADPAKAAKALRRHGARSMAAGDASLASVDLDEAQVAQLEKGAKEREEEEAAALKAVQEAQQAFNDLKDAGADAGQLRSAYKALKSAERKLDDLRFEAQLELRGVLNADQVSKLKERGAKRKAERDKNKREQEKREKERGPRKTDRHD